MRTNPVFSISYIVRNAFLIATIFLCSCAHSDRRGHIPLPALVIGPPNDAEMEELLGQPGLWRSLRTKTGTIVHADHTFNDLPDETLHRWFTAMSNQGLTVELEVGVIKGWSPNSAKTFEIERAEWNRIIRLGGHVVSLAMDEPLVSARSSFQRSDDYALDETAKFIELVREQYPSLRVGDIESYPYIPVSDHIKWIDSLNARLASLGIRGLDFYRVDPDWNAFPTLGDWNGVKVIINACNQRQVPSSLIYWASSAAGKKREGESASDLAWRDGVVYQAKAVKASRINPKQNVIQSWIGIPLKVVPEIDSTTFTGSVLTVIEDLK